MTPLGAKVHVGVVAFALNVTHTDPNEVERSREERREKRSRERRRGERRREKRREEQIEGERAEQSRAVQKRGEIDKAKFQISKEVSIAEYYSY